MENPHATTMEGSPGDDTWQREAVGAAGGATALRVARLATAFAWWASKDVWAMPVKFYVIWRSFGLGLDYFSPHDWALIWLGSGLSPLGLFCFA